MDFPLARQLIFRGLGDGDRIGGPRTIAGLLDQSLAERNGFDPEDILRRYIAWWESGGFDTGSVAARVFDLLLAGVSIADATMQANCEMGGRTAGCNPAHRIAPMAACPHIPDSQLAHAAFAEAALTHFDPLAGDVSAAVVVLIRFLINGESWEVALEEAAAGRMKETQLAMKGFANGVRRPTGYAPDVLAAAVHFVGSNKGYWLALEEAFSFAGPANYSPVLVGAIGAVRYSADLRNTCPIKPY